MHGRTIHYIYDLYFDYLTKKSFHFNSTTNKLENEIDLINVHSKGFELCWATTIKYSIRLGLRHCPNAKIFLDVGSGTGKAIYIALKSKKFEKVIGVELEQKLYMQSRLILQNVNNKKFFLHNENASYFVVPNEPTIIFLFNPFDEIILNRFISKNLNSIRITKSVIVYVNDVHSNLLLDLGLNLCFKNYSRLISVYN